MRAEPTRLTRFAVLVALLAAACTEPEPTQVGQLEPDAAWTGLHLAAGATHRFAANLEAGWALHLVVDQEQVDLEARITASDGSSLRVDSPPLRESPEHLCWVAPSSGHHTIDVSSRNGSGDYALRVRAFRPATPADRECAAAQAVFSGAYPNDRQSAPAAARIAAYDEAARRFDAAGEPFRAALTGREAATLLLRAARPAEAIPRFEDALEQARRSGSTSLVSSLLNRLANAYRRIEDLEKAETLYRQARQEAFDSGDRQGLATALTNLGRLAPDLGDPHGALDHLEEALSLWQAQGNLGEQAQTWINRGIALGTLDHQREAADAFVQAFELAERAGDVGRMVVALQSHGWSLYLKGRNAPSLALLERAFELSAGHRASGPTVAITDRLATVQAAAGQVDAAVELRRSLLARLDPKASPRDHAGASLNLGCLLAREGDAVEASELIRWAEPVFARTDDPMTRAHLAYCQALLAARQGDPRRAIEHVDRALEILAELRARARLGGHRFRPLRLWRQYADLAIDLRLDLANGGHQAPALLASAFEVYDQARAWSLFEQVVARKLGAGGQESNDPAEVRLQSLQKRLNRLALTRERLVRHDPAGRLEAVEVDLRRLAMEVEDARAELRARSRGAGELGSPRAVSVAELQALLPDRSMVLAYRLGSERSHLLTVTPSAIVPWALPPRATLEAHAEAFYRGLEASQTDPDQWRLVGLAFARQLLPPGAIHDQVDRLFLMVDGMLHYIPFAALASPRGGDSGAAPDLLIDDFEIAYLPSASVFVALAERRRGRPAVDRIAAAFVDAIFEPDDERLTGRKPEDPSLEPASRGLSVRRLPDGELPRLPYTADEGVTLERLVPRGGRDVWSGVAATKDNVLGTDLSAYRILHFATHAFIDEDLPELSGLVLSRYDAAGQPLDGKLYLHEIQNLDLAADLTVLSGCQTALGQHVEGNGLLGLTHGFFDAGSAQVLVTLWSVDDHAASILMTTFYERLLQDGWEPARALREAQHRLRRVPGYEAPYFWAQFVLHGAP